MDMITTMQISASGLSANRKRIEAISSNIANVNTTRTSEGGPYRKKSVIFNAEPARDIYSDILEGQLEENGQAVYAMETVSDNKAPILKYEPNNPDADDRGYVAYPNINVMEEIADLISAQRNYEANVNAMNITKGMAMKTLEIGKN